MASEAISLSALGLELRRLRLKARLSQQEVADRLGIHRNSLSRYEGGADVPAIVFLRLCGELEGNIPEIIERILKAGN